jgi:hypothetical protein
MLEAGPDCVLPSVGGLVTRERSALGAGSASLPGGRGSAELEDGSNRLDSALYLLLDAMGWIGPWPAIEANSAEAHGIAR